MTDSFCLFCIRPALILSNPTQLPPESSMSNWQVNPEKQNKNKNIAFHLMRPQITHQISYSDHNVGIAACKIPDSQLPPLHDDHFKKSNTLLHVPSPTKRFNPKDPSYGQETRLLKVTGNKYFPNRTTTWCLNHTTNSFYCESLNKNHQIQFKLYNLGKKMLFLHKRSPPKNNNNNKRLFFFSF